MLVVPAQVFCITYCLEQIHFLKWYSAFEHLLYPSLGCSDAVFRFSYFHRLQSIYSFLLLIQICLQPLKMFPSEDHSQLRLEYLHLRFILFLLIFGFMCWFHEKRRFQVIDDKRPLELWQSYFLQEAASKRCVCDTVFQTLYHSVLETDCLTS